MAHNSKTDRSNRYSSARVGTVVTYRRGGKLYRAEVGPSGKLIGRRQVQS